MSIGDRFRAGLARQLSRPEGLRGRVVGNRLNANNQKAIAAAIDATGLGPGQVAADVGFGGGIGLKLLLDRVAPGGHVHGVELSDTMLAAARRRHRADVAAGSMTLARGTLQELPLADGEVDGLVSVNTLYFIDDLAPVFAQTARVLAPGGRAVFGVADPEWMVSMSVTAHVFRLRPIAELVVGLEAAGLAVRDELLEDGVRRFHLLVANREVG